ncbi:DUF4145 domain-containing protein [Pseudomonas sp. PSPC2-3]|uniref:DUF4145 domain-containing protein n=1 Tax=Pseudomonas sp. PSPC2-3 TaxID=2804561 RepID=UPI003CF2C6D6
MSGYQDGGHLTFPFLVCRCSHCKKDSLWAERRVGPGFLIFPPTLPAVEAHEALPEDCRLDFEEARAICELSPRGAAAILRLCLQKLLRHLGGSGDHIDTDIKLLVSQGLDSHIQQALDVIRVTGNNAVHPLEMNLEDDHDSVTVLFEMINFIVEERISRPLRTQDRFANLPEKARLAIEKRDKPKA